MGSYISLSGFKYELVINLKTAKVLNLEIPRSLLLIADEVIEWPFAPFRRLASTT